MKIRNKELRTMSPADLNSRLKEIKTDLMKVRTDFSRGGQQKNPMQLRTIRRTIAKILTVKNIKEKELSAGIKAGSEEKKA